MIFRYVKTLALTFGAALMMQASHAALFSLSIKEVYLGNGKRHNIFGASLVATESLGGESSIRPTDRSIFNPSFMEFSKDLGFYDSYHSPMSAGAFYLNDLPWEHPASSAGRSFRDIEQPKEVPEPGSLILFALGILGIVVLRRRMSTSAKPKTLKKLLPWGIDNKPSSQLNE